MPKGLVEDLFAYYDKDESGFIDADELQALLEDLGETPDDETLRDAQEIMGGSDGKVPRDGFVDWFMKDYSVSQVKAAWEAYDKDGSGVIDKAELGDLLKDLAMGSTPEVIDEVMAKADLDKSDKLEFPEFLNFFNNNWKLARLRDTFAMYDVNEDERLGA